MNQIELLLFSFFRERIGKEKMQVSLGKGETVEDLFVWLIDQYPRAAFPLKSLRFAVNGAYVSTKKVLQDGDEVALIPPVAGG